MILLLLVFRFEFLAEGDPDMNKEVAFSTMVENIPDTARSSPALYGYFDKLFPGKVLYVRCQMTDYLLVSPALHGHLANFPRKGNINVL